MTAALCHVLAVGSCHANAVGIINQPHVRVHLASWSFWPKMFNAKGAKATELHERPARSVGLALEVLSTTTREVRREEPAEELRACVVCKACGAHRMMWDESMAPPKRLRDSFFQPCGDGRCMCGLFGSGTARAAGHPLRKI